MRLSRVVKTADAVSWNVNGLLLVMYFRRGLEGRRCKPELPTPLPQHRIVAIRTRMDQEDPMRSHGQTPEHQQRILDQYQMETRPPEATLYHRKKAGPRREAPWGSSPLHPLQETVTIMMSAR